MRLTYTANSATQRKFMRKLLSDRYTTLIGVAAMLTIMGGVLGVKTEVEYWWILFGVGFWMLVTGVLRHEFGVLKYLDCEDGQQVTITLDEEVVEVDLKGDFCARVSWKSVSAFYEVEGFYFFACKHSWMMGVIIPAEDVSPYFRKYAEDRIKDHHGEGRADEDLESEAKERSDD